MAQFRSLLKAAVLIGSTCFGTTRARQQGRFPQETLSGKAAQHGDEPQFGYSQDALPGEAARAGSWADVARVSAEWWARSMSSAASGDQSSSSLKQRAPDGLDAEESPFRLTLGTPPLGDSPWDCDKALLPKDMAICTENQSTFYSSLPGMHAEDRLTAFEDVGIYLASAADERAYPCRTKYADISGRNQVEVVFDAQFSNQPNCCPQEYLPDKSDAANFKALAGAVYPVNGSNVSYSVLEPVVGNCSAAEPCPVIVELTGFDSMPWMLLQAWCTNCMASLRSLVVSMSSVPGSSRHVEEELMPAIRHFFDSRNDYDIHRVYLVSTRSGAEAGLLAVLRYPDLFAFGLFAGKFRFTKDIEAAALNLTSDRQRLRKLSFQIGSADTDHNQEQDFWVRFNAVVKPIVYPMLVEVRYYPGGPSAVWYAGWNAYHDLLWTGKKYISQYYPGVALTCKPNAEILFGEKGLKYEKKLNNKVFGQNSVSFR